MFFIRIAYGRAQGKSIILNYELAVIASNDYYFSAQICRKVPHMIHFMGQVKFYHGNEI